MIRRRTLKYLYLHGSGSSCIVVNASLPRPAPRVTCRSFVCALCLHSTSLPPQDFAGGVLKRWLVGKMNQQPLVMSMRAKALAERICRTCYDWHHHTTRFSVGSCPLASCLALPCFALLCLALVALSRETRTYQLCALQYVCKLSRHAHTEVTWHAGGFLLIMFSCATLQSPAGIY
jgi:hypothetical protein